MSLPRFTPRQIEAFITVSEQLSFKGAGLKLNLTPSAISQLINELESILGFKLFNRTTRSVTISSAGTEFLGPSRSIIKQLSVAESAATDVRERKSGIVRIAAPLAIACTVLPEAIYVYSQLKPNVSIKIRDTSVENLVSTISNSEVDLAIGPDRPISIDIKRISVFDSPWVLWCSKHHPLAAQDIVRWYDLRHYPIIAAGRDHERSVRQMKIELIEHENIGPIDIVDNLTTALGVARYGLAVTLAPAYVAVLARPLGLTMKRVIETEVIRQVCLYSSSERSMSPAAEGFQLFLEKWLPNWGNDI